MVKRKKSKEIEFKNLSLLTSVKTEEWKEPRWIRIKIPKLVIEKSIDGMVIKASEITILPDQDRGLLKDIDLLDHLGE